MTGSEASRSSSPAEPTTGVAAGVPFLAVPPGRRTDAAAPIVVAWHLMDSPRTEAAFAAALPLAGLDAWRIYLGLPMFGSRTLAGGFEEFMRRANEDAVLNIYGPVCDQAAAEFEPALTELRDRLHLGSGPVGLIGGSAGAAVALLVLAEGNVTIPAAVLVSPLVQLSRAVDAMSAQFGVTYDWSDRAREVASRLDFVERAGEVAQKGQPAILLLVGEDDDAGFREPAAALRDALRPLYADAGRVELVTVSRMAHALADEPGIDPAPQTPHAAEVDRLAAEWLSRHLATI
jgi:dienelactone hydrolase